MMWRKIAGIAGISIVCSFAVSNSVLASEKRADLVISPAIVEWIITPGSYESKKVIVRNTTAQPMPVRAIAQKFIPREKITDKNDSIFDAASWFQIGEPDFILKPNEYREVTMTLNVPQNAEPGGHYATIYFQQFEPVTPQRLQQTNVVARVGLLAFITVKGDLKQEATTQNFTIKRTHREFVFATTLKNTGNTHILPNVSYQILDWHGRSVVSIKTNPGVLLPHTERLYEATWKPPLFGRFKVVTTFTADSQHVQTIATQTLWHIPWLLIALVTTAPVVVWFGLYRLRFRWRRAWHALWKT